MALTFFDSQQSGNDLPFVNDFVKENKKVEGNQYVVEEIRATKSGKGYLLTTPSFICHIWKKQKVATQLIEALAHYVESGKGYEIFVVINKKAKDGFLVAVDFERETTWFGVGNGYSTQEELSVSNGLGTNSNPFLPSPL